MLRQNVTNKAISILLVTFMSFWQFIASASNLDSFTSQLFAVESELNEFNVDKVTQPKLRQIYYLEVDLINAYLNVLRQTDLKDSEVKALRQQFLSNYLRLRELHENLLRRLIVWVESVLPGVGGSMLKVKSDKGETLYLPNYRSDYPLSEDQKEEILNNKKREFETLGYST